MVATAIMSIAVPITLGVFRKPCTRKCIHDEYYIGEKPRLELKKPRQVKNPRQVELSATKRKRFRKCDVKMAEWCATHIEQLQEKYKLLIGAKLRSTIGIDNRRIERIIFGAEVYIVLSDNIQCCVKYEDHREFPVMIVRELPERITCWRREMRRHSEGFFYKIYGTIKDIQVQCRICGHLPRVSLDLLSFTFESEFNLWIPKPLLEIISGYVGHRILTEPNWVPLSAWFGSKRTNNDEQLKQILLSGDIQQTLLVS